MVECTGLENRRTARYRGFESLFLRGEFHKRLADHARRFFFRISFKNGWKYQEYVLIPFYHMWYLYMLIGLYLVTPVINHSISNLSRKNVWIVAIVLLAIGIINNAFDLVTGNEPFFILWFVNYLGYFMLGYLLKGYRSRFSVFLLLFIYLLSVAAISVLSFFTAKYWGNLYFYEYLSPFVIVVSLSIYIVFQQINVKANVLSRISHLTLGVYLIHAGILRSFNLGLEILHIKVFDNPIIGIPAKFLLALLLSVAIAHLFYRSKLLKRII